MIRKNISYSLFANISRLLFGLSVFLILSKILKLEDFGLYVYLMTISAFFGILIDYGFNLSLLNKIPKNKEKIKDYFFETIIAKFYLSILSIFIFYFFIKLTDNDNLVYLLSIFLLATIVQSFAQLVTTVYKAINKFEVDFYYAFFNNLFILIIILINYNDLTLIKIAYIYLFSKSFIFIYLFIDFLKYFKQYSTNKISFKIDPIKSNFKYAIHMIIGGFFLTIDIPIMKEILTLNEVAIYSLGMKLFVALMVIGDVTNSSFLPKLSEYYSNNKIEFNKLIKKMNLVMISLGVVISISTYLLGGIIIKYFFNEDFLPLIDLIPLFSLAIFVRYFSFSFGTLLTVAGKQKTRSTIMVLIFILHVILNIYFQNKFAIEGAIIALNISLLLLTILNMIFVYFTFKDELLFNKVRKC